MGSSSVAGSKPFFLADGDIVSLSLLASEVKDEADSPLDLLEDDGRGDERKFIAEKGSSLRWAGSANKDFGAGQRERSRLLILLPALAKAI